jgi:hypothetical protein
MVTVTVTPWGTIHNDPVDRGWFECHGKSILLPGWWRRASEADRAEWLVARWNDTEQAPRKELLLLCA